MMQAHFLRQTVRSGMQVLAAIVSELVRFNWDPVGIGVRVLPDAADLPGDLEVGERAVDNVILRLRRRLGDPELIVTVRGVGFRLAER